MDSPWIRPRSLFSKIFNGLLFGCTPECNLLAGLPPAQATGISGGDPVRIIRSAVRILPLPQIIPH